MNIRDLEYFLAICNEGGITKAAKETHMSPQGLSSLIRKMEKELGIELLERSSGGVKPTEYGEILFNKSHNIVDIFQDIQTEINNLKKQNEGFVRLVSAYGVLRMLTPEFIFNFNDEYKHIHLDYMEFPDKYIDEMIENGAADVGFAIGPIDSENFDARLIYSTKMLLLVHKDDVLAEKKQVSMTDIKNREMIIESDMFKMHDIFVDACKNHGFDPNIRFNTSGYSLCHKLCAQKKGLSITLESIFEDMATDSLKAIPFNENLTWDVFMITKKCKKSGMTLDLFKNYVCDWTKDKIY